MILKYNPTTTYMAGKKKSKEQENIAPEPQKIKVNATPDKTVPKFCTHVNFGVTQDKHVIISLVFQEGQPGEEQATLIERVVTTYDHAKQISKVLNDLIERVEKNGIDNPNQ